MILHDLSFTELSCSVTTLTVSLVDVNDNAPQWTLREFIIGQSVSQSCHSHVIIHFSHVTLTFVGVNETALPNDTIGKIEVLQRVKMPPHNTDSCGPPHRQRIWTRRTLVWSGMN